jgi:hypothetical protein
MNAVSSDSGHGRGVDLLLLHCRALDYDRPSAGERLEQRLGRELAELLVAALTSNAGRETRARVAA